MTEPDLKRFPLLAELAEPEREAIAELLEPLELAAERQLFREGQEAEGLVLLERGALRLECRRRGALGACGAGTVLGGLSLVAVGPREATAVATERSRVWVLSRTSFHRLVEDAPRAACRLLAAVLADFAQAVRGGLPDLAGGGGGA